MKPLVLPPFSHGNEKNYKVTGEFRRVLSAIQFSSYVMDSPDHQRPYIYSSRFARMSKETSLAAERVSASTCNAGTDKRISEFLKINYFGSCKVSNIYTGVSNEMHRGGYTWMSAQWSLDPVPLAAAGEVHGGSPGQSPLCRDRGHHGDLPVL